MSSAKNIVVDSNKVYVYGHSVDKCIAELHADIECVNSLQNTTEASGNPNLVGTHYCTDRFKENCMHGVHNITEFWEVETMSPTVQITDV